MALERAVLDTDVVIDFLRGRGAGVAAVRRQLTRGLALVSSITAFELRQGALTQDDQEAVGRFCTSRTLPFSLGSALRAGEVGELLRRSGVPIGPADTLIAGLCLHHALPLLTNNVRHFDRVPDLRVLRPAN